MFAFVERFRAHIEPKKKKYRLWVSPIAFGFGFVLDLFTLNRIDQKLDLAILLTHLTLATGWVSLWHFNRSRKKKFQKWKRLKKFAKSFAPAAMQFSFGALFSGFVIFYTKSSSLLVSWPFLIVIYLLFLGNEAFRKFYRGLFFQVGVLYFSILTILIFLVPLWFKSIGTDIFILSGLLSLIVIGLIFRVMAYWFKSINSSDHKRLWLWVFSIWMGVNVLYYENLIPPIPLSLKSDGLYYHIEREGTEYEVIGPEREWWMKFLPWDKIEKPEGEWIYYFSSVFAPAEFQQRIIHEWQYFDPRRERWVHVFEQEIKIVGGRDGGFRGYSYLVDPAYGKWRVLVRIPGKQVFGQKNFEIIEPGTEKIKVEGGVL